MDKTSSIDPYKGILVSHKNNELMIYDTTCIKSIKEKAII